MEHSDVAEIDAPRDSAMACQRSPAKRSKPSHRTRRRDEESPLHPDPSIGIPGRGLPRQGGSDVGASPHPSPMYEGGPTAEDLEILETPLNNRFTPQDPEAGGEGGVGGAA